MKRKAVVLLSGGIDSTTALAMARSKKFEIHAISFDYGQRHRCELEAARRVASFLGVDEHLVMCIDLGAFGGSALTAPIDVPKNDSVNSIGSAIPVTYVPARNTIFLSFALAWAETLGAHDIFIGVNAVDYSGYPDCRPEFIEAFEQMANLATKISVEAKNYLRIHTPLIGMTKAEIIREGIDLDVDFALTHSCYDPRDDAGSPCGRCDACLLRLKGFSDANLEDPFASYPKTT